MARWILVGVIAAAVAACSSSRRMDGDRDSGGPRGDSGSDRDAGPPGDVGPPMDGGTGDAGRVDPVDGGVVECPEPMPSYVCDSALCGNGMIDSCMRCYPCGPPGGGGGGGPPPPPGECCDTLMEECDGAAIGGATCESLGYARGPLTCGGWCGLDTKDCYGCTDDPHIVRCLRADVESTVPYALDLAATDEAIGIAWVTTSGDAGEGARAHFAHYAPDLSIVAESGCYDVPDAYSIAIASSPSGWLIAVGTRGSNVYVIPVDRDGALRGAMRMIPGAGSPSFGSRPGGGPLLVYALGLGGGVIQAELLRDDGSAEWTARPFGAASAIEPHLGDIAFMGDAFLVVQRIDGVTIVRVELDGTVGAPHQPGGTLTETPQISWNGVDGRVTWTDFGGTGTALYARIDAEGRRTSPPVTLGMIPMYFNRHPLVPFGQDTAIVHSTYTGGVDLASRLDVSLVDLDGRETVRRFGLTQDPNGARAYRAERIGGNVVLAWIGGGHGTPGFGPGNPYPGRISLALVNLGGGPM